MEMHPSGRSELADEFKVFAKNAKPIELQSMKGAYGHPRLVGHVTLTYIPTGYFDNTAPDKAELLRAVKVGVPITVQGVRRAAGGDEVLARATFSTSATKVRDELLAQAEGEIERQDPTVCGGKASGMLYLQPVRPK